MNSIHRVGVTIAGVATVATVAGAFGVRSYVAAQDAAAQATVQALAAADPPWARRRASSLRRSTSTPSPHRRSFKSPKRLRRPEESESMYSCPAQTTGTREARTTDAGDRPPPDEAFDGRGRWQGARGFLGRPRTQGPARRSTDAHRPRRRRPRGPFGSADCDRAAREVTGRGRRWPPISRRLPGVTPTPIIVQRPIQYVQLQPGQTAPPGATVIDPAAPQPTAVVISVPAPTQAPIVIRTTQSGRVIP